MPGDFKSATKTLGIIIVLLIIGSYAFFEARGLILGPVIEIREPENGQSFNNSLITIRGYAKNVASISLNDDSITVDEKGDFIEKLLLSPGYNIIKLKVVDRFGREKISFLELMLKTNS